MYQLTWRNARDGGPVLGPMVLPPSGSIRLGRSRDAELLLDDKEVSRFHAVIISNGASVEVADTGSANGTKLGRTRISHTGWSGTDSLLVGPFELRLEGVGEPASHKSGQATPFINGEAPNSDDDGRLDARPKYGRAKHSLWDAAMLRRDAFVEKTRSILEAEKINAELDVSNHGVYPPTMVLRCWLPTEHSFDDFTRTHMRSQLAVSVDVKPFHTYKFEHTVKLTRAGKEHSLSLIPEKTANFNETDIHTWVMAALDLGPVPPTKKSIPRRVLESFLPWIAFHNKVAKPYRDPWGLRRILLFVGFGGLLLSGLPFLFGPVMGLVGIAILIYLYVTRAKTELVCMPPSPQGTPETLRRWGSWDIVLPQLGDDFESVKARLLEAIADRAPERIELDEEVFAYFTPDGIERRSRHVFKHRQCQVHLHTYRFGRDMFVGWEAFLNESQWGESGQISTRRLDRSTVQFKEVRPAKYTPSEFDWIDLRALADFVHRRLEQIITRLLKERSIDMQLDFTINRSGFERSSSLEGKAPEDAKKNPFKLFKSA